MKTLITCTPGAFHELSGSWFLPTEEIQASTEITIGPKLPVTCMFEINFALVNGERVGFIFTSRFEVENGGTYLMTYLRNKGQATEHETLVKDETLVVYHYPNKGTLAISPVVNQKIATIFDEQ
jgi:hypothetical protein